MGSIVHIIVVATSMMLLMLSSDGIFLTRVKGVQQLRNQSSLVTLRSVVRESLRNFSAWNTMKNPPDATCNTSLNCLVNHQNCAAFIGAPQPLTCLYDVSGENLIFDSRIPTNGFTSDGKPCNTYSLAGDPACPLRIHMTWTPNCSANPCFDKNALIKVTFQAAGLGGYTINTENYTFTEYVW